MHYDSGMVALAPPEVIAPGTPTYNTGMSGADLARTFGVPGLR